MCGCEEMGERKERGECGKEREGRIDLNPGVLEESGEAT
jgi:hypothetical protein